MSKIGNVGYITSFDNMVLYRIIRELPHGLLCERIDGQADDEGLTMAACAESEFWAILDSF
jgi:hypothetical protein